MVLVVLVHGGSQVLLTFPVFFNFVILLENPDEIHDIFFSDVLNAKVIHKGDSRGLL